MVLNTNIARPTIPQTDTNGSSKPITKAKKASVGTGGAVA